MGRRPQDVAQACGADFGLLGDVKCRPVRS